MKKELRRKTAAKTAALEREYTEAADRKIREHVFASHEYRTAKLIFCYVGTSREIDTLPLIRRALSEGKRICVPFCRSLGIMEAREICGEDELVDGAYEIPAPRSDAPTVDPKEIGLCIVPCVACNRRGERLGYGGGFYDRYLPKTDCPMMMLARECIMTEEIPTEPHDLTIGCVVTEEGIFDGGIRRNRSE